jgi:hypothetical protein
MTTTDRSTLCHAFALSLACALIESARNDTDPRSALGNRLARAASATERSIEFFPRVRNHVAAMALADQFLALIENRIDSFITHGGWRRGEVDCDRFMQNMLERLNDPKNAAKGDYRQLTLSEIQRHIQEEASELDDELQENPLFSIDVPALVHEAADLAVVAMIAAVKAESL